MSDTPAPVRAPWAMTEAEIRVELANSPAPDRRALLYHTLFILTFDRTNDGGWR